MPSLESVSSKAKKVSGTIGKEVIVLAVAWNATVLAQYWMNAYFEKKGLKNFWGLKQKGDKTVLTAEEFAEIQWGLEYGVGLVMMVGVTLLLKWLFNKYKHKFISADTNAV